MTNYQYLANCDFKELLFFVCENSCCSCCKDRNIKCSNCKKKRKIIRWLKSFDTLTGKTQEQILRKSDIYNFTKIICNLSFTKGCSDSNFNNCSYYDFFMGLKLFLYKQKTNKSKIPIMFITITKFSNNTINIVPLYRDLAERPKGVLILGKARAND